MELGTGFNPELSGLENIYFYGSLMGFSRQQMASKVEGILQFADIGEHIVQPLKTYSSGMIARVAFSCAVSIDPDILIIDEALAVGDARFQRKCMTKIQEFCHKTGQKVPASKGEILRVASESIALKYRIVFDQLAGLVRDATGEELGKVYMGGGGIQNQMLAQNAADAMGREVVAGPIEATSCGNLITQMLGLGDVTSIAEGRELILNSFEMETYSPSSPELWNAALERFKKVL